MNPDTIVVAGGRSSRMGGFDKAMLRLGDSGLTLLESTIDACPGRVFVVGPRRNIDREVEWVEDLVADGGPAAGVWSGLQQVKTDYVFLAAGDQILKAGDFAVICKAGAGNIGAWAVRSDGRGQPLCAVIQTELLRGALTETRGENVSLLRVLEGFRMVAVDAVRVSDIDTWSEAFSVARNRGDNLMELWLERLGQILDISVADIPVDDLLDLTREVAHNVERRAAPITTYLVGLAVREGRDVNEAISAVRIVLDEWKSSGD